MPEGATDWEAQEARRAWRNALASLDDTLARVATIRERFLAADPNTEHADLSTAVNNAAGRLAEAALELGRWESITEGSLHRQAENRHRREAGLGASRRVARYLAAQAQLGGMDHERLHSAWASGEEHRLLASDLRALIDGVEPF